MQIIAGTRMNFVTQHSLGRAEDEASVLWGMASAQYPVAASRILDVAAVRVVEAASGFALNARRAIEVLPPLRIALTQARWIWKPVDSGEIVREFRDALNRIVHAQVLVAGFERLPDHLSVIDGGAVVIPYIQAKTDRRDLAYIDIFAIAHAFFYQVVPALSSPIQESKTRVAH